jgi:hypothetical protein
MAASKKSAYLFDDGYNTAKDVEAYASSLNIDLDTAAHQLSLQELAGDLDAELSRKEADTYAGLWIQHSPQFRIIVQFTQVHNPGQADQRFRCMPITDSVSCRSVIPAMPIRQPGDQRGR